VVTLRYAKIDDGKTWPATPVVVQRQAERLFALLPGFEGVLFTVASGMDDNVDGVYYYSLPFGASAGDGGVSDATQPTLDAAASAADAATD
jgi:hypothetical protein